MKTTIECGCFQKNLPLFFTIALGFVSLKLLDFLYQIQNNTYIDEVFHVPQAQLYCKNEWSKWNSKITTPPGLYLISYMFLKPLEKFGYHNYCSLYSLRITNLIGTILNFYLVFKIGCSLEKNNGSKTPSYFKLFTALNITIFPPLYFFTFLYYTDVWSTTFVLLMYHSHLSKGKYHRIFAAFFSLMAVLIRQTNIIWVGLLIIDNTWNVLIKNNKPVPVQDYIYTFNVLRSLFIEYFNYKKISRRSLLSLINNIITESYHYGIVCLLFIIFVILNGSIVVGDKEAHTVIFHPMQNLYFLAFIGFFGFPFFILEFLSIWKNPPNIFSTIFLIGLCSTLSEVNKLEHPYLLADNRHLAFYLWKKIFGQNILRWIVVPVYVFSGILLQRVLKKKCHFMFMVGLSICTFLNLTPQFLFELRYFIIPFIMFRLQFKENYAIFLETLFFILINAAVIYLFCSKTFIWPSEPNISQRFIW